jgi:hypothetical protein
MMLREMRRSSKKAGILFRPNVQYFTVLSEIPKGIPVLYLWLNEGWGNLWVRVRVALCTPGGIPMPFSKLYLIFEQLQHVALTMPHCHRLQNFHLCISTIHFGFETQLLETSKFGHMVSKIHSHNTQCLC